MLFNCLYYMKTPLLWVFAIAASTTTFYACSEHMESGCACASVAVQVIALDELGASISLDSLHYRLDSGAIESMVLTNGNPTALVGTAAGHWLTARALPRIPCLSRW